MDEIKVTVCDMNQQHSVQLTCSFRLYAWKKLEVADAVQAMECSSATLAQRETTYMEKMSSQCQVEKVKLSSRS